MAPIAAAMYAVAGVVVALLMLLPQPAAVNRAVLLSIAGLALALAALIWALRRRLSPSFFHLTTASGSLIIGVSVVFSGEAHTPFGLMLLWVAVFAAYFFTRSQFMAHMALGGLIYALALAIHPQNEGHELAQWLVTMVAVGVAGVAILHLVRSRRELEAEREDLLAQTMRLALTDSLTGLPNRRAWLEQLDREIAAARRNGSTLCVAMLDFDHFKAFNDRYGHIQGDALLREAAATWRRLLRPRDTIARYGGEEFALLLPDCAVDAATEVVERLRAEIPRDERCSGGVACWDGTESPLELLARADRRLYEAKALGRDQLVAAA